jgi:hypothetical protein
MDDSSLSPFRAIHIRDRRARGKGTAIFCRFSINAVIGAAIALRSDL